MREKRREEKKREEKDSKWVFSTKFALFEGKMWPFDGKNRKSSRASRRFFQCYVTLIGNYRLKRLKDRARLQPYRFKRKICKIPK